MPEPPTYTAICAWCGGETVAFVGPPHMVEVTITAAPAIPRQAWQVCTECHVECLKLIATRSARADAAPR